MRIYKAVFRYQIMLSFTSSASKAITDAVAKIPENEELGEKLIDICLVILGKAVKLTKHGHGRSTLSFSYESNQNS